MGDIMKWLNGKKTYLAIVAYVIVQWLISNGTIGAEQADNWLNVVYGWAGIAIVHKITKALPSSA